MTQNTLVKKNKNFNLYFLIYLCFLGFTAVIYLYEKHTVGNDSTISAWLINYQGGFVRRGFIGEICFQIAKLFNSDLRFVIFLFQSFFYLTFLFLTFNFFKNIRNTPITIFAIYTPIFLLYPVAEVEVLARKEVFLYIYFLCFLSLCTHKSIYEKYINYYVLFVTPLFCMINEMVIFFFPFIVVCLIFHKKINNLVYVLKICLLFLPSLLIVMYFFAYPLTIENHKIMEQSLLINFNEICYMSCALVIVHDISQIEYMSNSVFGGSSPYQIITWVIRYSFIFLIGFFPLLLISKHSTIRYLNILSFLGLGNILFLMLFLFLPVLPFFYLANDWGRYMGMLISFSTFFYFYLYKFNHININFNSLSKTLSFFNQKRKFTIIIFIIFAFGWNQKTVMSGDIATNPLWKVPYNLSKKIFNWNGIRILQDSSFSIWHKKYIE
jgi:hypothetical protein